MTLGFALFGAGRIGRMHASHLSRHPDICFVSVFDVNQAAAQETAQRYNIHHAQCIEDVFSDTRVHAVLIASSTPTHIDLITRAAQAGKAVLCEKPIDLNIGRVEQCRQAIAAYSVPIQLGFNRRWDPGHRRLIEAIRQGEIGDIEQIVITSRDPCMPPVPFLKDSGGIFLDMMIHDFDLMRYILNEEPTEVIAIGSRLIDPEILKIDDIDSAMVLMRTASGKLCHINNARRACYGYDQRIEVLGSLGMLISGNRTATNVEHYHSGATTVREPLLTSFVDRYTEAYRLQLDAFVHTIKNGQPATPSFEDGRQSLILANAALASFKTGRPVCLGV
jgi:myo-inositol 2-dehydrogenase / D-chiro-inositol 1-dehydrogenase